MKVQKIALWALFIALISCHNSTNHSSAFFHSDTVHSGYYDTRGLDSLTGTAWVFKTGGTDIFIAGDL